MQESRLLIEQAIVGRRPARTPTFDILCNEAVVEHFARKPLDGADDLDTMFAAVGNALDGTRAIFAPSAPGTKWVDEVGNTHVTARWTEWITHHALADADAWVRWLRTHLDEWEAAPEPTAADRQRAGEWQCDYNARLNGSVNIFSLAYSAIVAAIFHGCGLEIFAYLWEDERELVLRWLRAQERIQRHRIMLTAQQAHSPLAMILSDVAYKHRLMFSRETFDEIGYFDNIADLCALCHAEGLKVIFHSDGYIMDIVDDLIAAGIDGLNPIEKAAGMDIYALRRRYPELILVGGMDVTHLLRTGAPDDIRAETRRMIREVGAEGRLLIGSSTEVEDNVPLANYLAFHAEVMNNPG